MATIEEELLRQQMQRQAGIDSLRAASPGYEGNQLRLKAGAASIRDAASRVDLAGTRFNTSVSAGRLTPEPVSLREAAANATPRGARVDLNGSRFSTPVQLASTDGQPMREAPARAVPPRNVPVTDAGMQRFKVTQPRAQVRPSGVTAPPPPQVVAPAAAPAAPAARGPIAQAAYTMGKAAGTAGRVIGPAGAAVGALNEGYDIARVAADPNRTGIDVATQASEGAAKVAGTTIGAVAGAKAGAALGALGGPAAPVTVPAGAVIGGVAGGLLGREGIANGINYMRSLLGLNPKSPVDGTPELGAQPAVRAAQAAPVPATPPQRQPNAQPAPVRQPLNTGSGQRGARTIAETAPQYRFSDGETEGNVVQVIRPGSEISYATFGPNGPEGEVPAEVFEAGKTSQYRSAIADAAQRSLTDPGNALAKQELVNKGQVEQQRAANEGAEAAARVRAETDRLPKPEVLKDSMGNATGTVNWRRTENGFEPVMTPLKAKPDRSRALAQAKAAAEKPGADHNAIRSIYTSYGYDPKDLSFLK